MSILTAPSRPLAAAIAEFGEPRGYVAAASIGLPPRRAVEALRADLDAWARADRDPQGYDPIIARTREHYARLVGVDVARVAIGSQTSVQAALVAAAMPAGAEILVVEGDFSSIITPFQERGELRVRAVPLAALADAIDERTTLVAFSLVQSATGVVADAAAIREAAARHGALTFCDTTQATGVLPVAADDFDLTVCHAYKWLCSPRGVCFLTVGARADAVLRPVQGGWYAGQRVWQSCYGPDIALAADARRFDVSPAWQAWVGAEQSIGLFAGLDIAEIWERASGLGAALTEALGLPVQRQAIVAWPDPEGAQLTAMTAAGIRISGRAGRARASFHLWNTADDVEAILRALRS
ncbi:aminotransferase class V-fold PLP-dependent enzyme [Protaetiibacter larvae]|uniref:Aminotransferase class V-fold PLP-dependent enzyme n=1 Tax=Protaetiibacter larvae TaxID=2592654 RepID=A0A5C1YAM6_9MICO|nr:aminotransferase class V-fold PLP-dependent enzyme [Protaetiibacter larvae]QEO10269.1 aminotransferase class V-fold PLP-dependent enzyme [Protaetiibacter larvae]